MGKKEPRKEETRGLHTGAHCEAAKSTREEEARKTSSIFSERGGFERSPGRGSGFFRKAPGTPVEAMAKGAQSEAKGG